MYIRVAVLHGVARKAQEIVVLKRQIYGQYKSVCTFVN